MPLDVPDDVIDALDELLPVLEPVVAEELWELPLERIRQ